MDLPRRFLNLIVKHRGGAMKSLRRIDLARQHFFYPTAPPPNGNGSESESESALAQGSTCRTQAADANKKNKQAAAALKMQSIRLPRPSFNFESTPTSNPSGHQWSLHCFPLTESKVICVDESARAVLFDADEHHFITMPSLHAPKRLPISLFIPSAEQNGLGTSLYVMESIPHTEPEPQPEQNNSVESHQFEAFIICKPRFTTHIESWRCQRLPTPPYAFQSSYNSNSCKYTEISSYAVVGGGSHICISTKGIGTYCLDTASHTWSKVGKWTLPFYGKAEYVPELKLWFGLSAKAQLLCASDLSTMDSQPQLVGAWKELDPPEEWRTTQDPQLVNLGSGRFCIARFFDTIKTRPNCFGDDVIDQDFAVLTGVEVVPGGNEDKHAGNGDDVNGDGDGDGGSGNGDGDGDGGSGNGNGGNGKRKGLRMIKHKSRRVNNGTTIDRVF